MNFVDPSLKDAVVCMVNEVGPQSQEEGVRIFTELCRKSKKPTVAISTAKRSKEELQLGNYVPPEGHCAFLVPLEPTSAALISFGGVSHKDQVSTSSEAALIIITEIIWDDDLVSRYDDLLIIPPIKMAQTQPSRAMRGSTFLGFCGSAAALIGQKNADIDFLVFGGQSVYDNKTTNFVYKISTNCKHKSKKRTNCTVYLPPSPKNPVGSLLQDGPIPTPRMSHTLTALSAHDFLVIGGFQTDNQCRPSPISDSLYQLALTEEAAHWKQLISLKIALCKTLYFKLSD